MSEMTCDSLLNDRVRIKQKRDGFRTAIDAVLLAAACPAAPEAAVLDAGCGVGSAGLCVQARVKCRMTGIDILPDNVELALINAADNGFGASYAGWNGSIADPPAIVASTQFDHVLCNPPYLPEGYGSAADTMETHESNGVTLADWVAFCARRVRDGGSVIFVHRADRLPELLVAMSATLGNLAIFPLWPKADEVSHRVIVGGIRGRKTPPRLLPGLALHRGDGGFTPEAESILRDAQPICLWTP